MTLGPDGWVYTLEWVFVCKQVILKGFCPEWLFLWKSGFFFVSFENFALIWRSHHFQRSAVECFCSHNHCEGSLSWHIYTDRDKVISEDQWHWHSSVLQWSCSYIFWHLGLSPPELEPIPFDTCDTCTWTLYPFRMYIEEFKLQIYAPIRTNQISSTQCLYY